MNDATLTPDDDMDHDDWYGPDIATFGDRLAAAREKSGMSKSQLARRLGVKPSTLRGWEQDISEPRANRLSMMAGLMGVSIMWLLNGEGTGLDGEEGAGIDEDAEAVLREIRELRAGLVQSTERLGRLEKRLRTMMKGSA